jgi:HEAT repeat protein
MTTRYSYRLAAGLVLSVLGSVGLLPLREARAAATISARIDGAKKYPRGTDLRVEFSVVNNGARDARIRRPAKGDGGLELCLVKHGSYALYLKSPDKKERKVPADHLRAFMGKSALDSTQAVNLAPGKTASFKVNLRTLFSFPIREAGTYRLVLSLQDAAAEHTFSITRNNELLMEEALEWRKGGRAIWGTEYAVVRRKGGGGAKRFVLLQRNQGQSFTLAVSLGNTKPVAIEAVKLHKIPDASDGVLLMWLDGKSRLWVIPPLRLWKALRKTPMKIEQCRSFKAPGAVSFGAVEVARNERLKVSDFRIVLQTGPGKSKQTLYLRHKRYDIIAGSKREFEESKAEEAKQAKKVKAPPPDKREPTTDKPKRPTPADEAKMIREMREQLRRERRGEPLRQTKAAREQAAAKLMAAAERAKLNGKLEEARAKCQEVIVDYEDTSHLKPAEVLLKDIEKRIEAKALLNHEIKRGALQISMSRLTSSLERMGRSDGLLVEMIMAKLRAKHKGSEELRKAQGMVRKATPLALTKLRDENPRVRMSAAMILGEAGSDVAKAVPALAKALKDKDVRVRAVVALALGKIGPAAKAAIPSLKEASKDGDARVRKAATAALEAIKKEAGRAGTK